MIKKRSKTLSNYHKNQNYLQYKKDNNIISNKHHSLEQANTSWLRKTSKKKQKKTFHMTNVKHT